MENPETRPPEESKENPAETAAINYMRQWKEKVHAGFDHIMGYPDRVINRALDRIPDTTADKIHQKMDKIPTAALALLSSGLGSAIFYEASRGSLSGTATSSAVTAGILTSFFYARSYFRERQINKDKDKGLNNE